MPIYQHFEETPAWQEAARLYNAILDVLESHRCPFTSGFRNQLDRAGLSVSNNIAEGFERRTTAELKSFLAIARGSAGEVRSMLAVIAERPRVKPFESDIARISNLARSCAKQLTAWSRSLRQNLPPRKN